MIITVGKFHHLLLSVFLVCCILSAGCQTKDHKADTDKIVYDIIDQQWQPAFGPRTNYKVSDTKPSPDAIKILNPIPESGILTLPGAVAVATTNNRQYQTQKEDLYLKALDLRLALHQFEPSYSGGASTDYSRFDGNEDWASQTFAGFEQLLATGTTITTDVTVAWLEILTGDTQSGLTTLLSTTITQPLLRAGNSLVVQENLTQAQRDSLYQIRQFSRYRKEFVVSVAAQYYRLLEEAKKREYAKQNSATLDRVYKQAKILTQAGKLPRFELDQAAEDKIQADDILIQAQQQYKQALDEFKLILGIPVTSQIQLDANELDELQLAALNIPNFSEAQSIETAKKLRLDLANKSDAVYDAERKILVANDALKTRLDLTVQTDISTDRDTDFTSLRTAKAGVQAGLELELPLDQVAEENILRKAMINLTQAQRDHQQTADTIVLQVRQAYRDLTEASERYKLQNESVGLAQKRFENTLLLLQYGRANTRDVLDAQEDLFDARNTAIESLTDHTIAMLNFYRDTGVLHVRPDGMWEY